MTMFTRHELEHLRERLIADPGAFGRDPAMVERLIRQSEYALDCAALLDDAVHFPAEPYGEAETLVARLTDGVNRIWNFHRYREDASDRPGTGRGQDRPA